MFVFTFCSLVILIIVLYKIWAYNNHWKYVMKIPGPKGHPIIGNFESGWTPETLFEYDRSRARDFYPIHKVWGFHEYFISLMSPEDIEVVLSNAVHNKKSILYTFLEPWLGTGLLTSNGSKWHKRRKILTPAFHFTALQPYVDIFNKETQHLTEVLMKNCDQEYIDVVKPITDFTLNSIGETSLGVNLRDKNSVLYKNAIHQYGEVNLKRLINPLYYVELTYSWTKDYTITKKMTKILQNFSTEIIHERKELRDSENLSYSKRKRMALLDLMLDAKEAGADLDDEGIREEVDTFTFEGHDTTAMALCYILFTLATEQEYQAEIYEEILSIQGETNKHPTYQDLGNMKFMERCIKECLRIYPSVPFISRVAGETFKTHSGYTIPKGSILNIYIIDLHHSKEVWEDPEKFDPDRFLLENSNKRHPFAYVPFSAGGRNCIGQKFAMLELKAAVCGILKKFRLAAVDRREDLKFKCDLVLRPACEIKVKFIPR